MSRAGYSDDLDQGALNLWRASVERALRGKRGQTFLREMLAAMDALPEKKLITGDLVDQDGCACALGSVAIARGMDVSKVDPHDYESMGPLFGIAGSMAREIMFMNDEYEDYDTANRKWLKDTPETRYVRMRAWIEKHLAPSP